MIVKVDTQMLFPSLLRVNSKLMSTIVVAYELVQVVRGLCHDIDVNVNMCYRIVAITKVSGV
jgi:hypothetical protein